MADEYVVFPLEADPEELAAQAYDSLAQAFPGWVPSPAHVETWLIEALANMTAEAVTVGTTVPRAIFRAWGPLVGVPPVDASPARAQTTWTAVDDAGYTITAGSLVGARTAGDTIVAFEVDTDVVIPPGQTSTATGAVAVTAVEAGAAGTGLTGAMESLESLAWVETITIDGASSGGIDAEDDQAYLDRLTRELELITPRPILPDDFSVLAGRVAGVGRATAVDGLDPGDDSTGNERMVTVAVVDEDGQPVPSGVRAQVDALLQSLREVSFIVHVIDPTYQPVDVEFEAVAHPGYDPADVQARAVAAVEEFLSPARWGLPPTGDDSAHGGWWNVDTVRYFELVAALDRVQGLDYVTLLEIDSGTSDVALTGPITLPEPGTVTGLVVGP